MKLKHLILAAFLLACSLPAFGQITLSVSNEPLEKVLALLEQKSGYSIFYNDNLQGLKDPVSISVANKDIHYVMNLLLKDFDISWFIKDNGQITLRHERKTVPGEPERVKKKVTFTGLVSDSEGEPVPGAAVVQTGTSNGVITSADGRFSLAVLADGAVRLTVSCIGYNETTFVTDRRLYYEIRLEPSAEFLEEVVVVGMNNRQTRRSITGAVSTIQTKDLVQSPVANISNALAGKLPGLITVQSSGEPGADAASLYVRGVGTYGSSAPLVVIDGLPRRKTDFDMLDANEIESITILKDASSSSLYGIQGANGVVVVTTRRGRDNEKPKISFTMQQANQQPIRLPQTMSSYEQALYNRTVDFNDGQPLRYTPEVLEIIRSGSDPYQYPNTDWFDVVLKDHSWQQQYNVNISGTAGKSHRLRYFVSGSYINQGTLLNHNKEFEANYGVSSKYDRYNFRSNLDIEATRRLDIRIDLAGRLETRVGPSYGFPYVFGIITSRMPGSQSIFNPDGTLAAGSALEIPYINNPYGIITRSGYYNNTLNVMSGTISAKHDLDFLTEGLVIQGYFSFENSSSLDRSWSQTFEQFWYRGPDKDGNPVYQDYTTNGQLYGHTGSYVSRSTYYDIRLNYDREFLQNSVNAQILFNRTLKNAQSSEYMYAYQGLSARVAYNYAKRYFLEFNIGYNGSENFPPGRRYGVFPSFSAGWVLSDEAWLRLPDVVRMLKLRSSYGVVGNDKIGGDRFLFISEFGHGGGLDNIFPSGYYFGTTNGGTMAAGGYNETRVGNAYVTWEKSRKFNVGVDVSLFKGNVLNFSLDFFREKRVNILTPAGRVPDYIGIPNVAPRNSGKVLNYGLEGEVRLFKQINKDLSLFTNLQFTWAKNKVLENDQPTPSFEYQDLRGYEIGYELGYHAIGYFQDQEDIDRSPVQNFGPVIPGDIKYEDTSKDGRIDPSDRVPVKCYSVPTLVGGLSLGINYKGFDFSMMFSGAAGSSARLFAYSSSIINLRRWTETNRDAILPAAHTTANNNLISDQNLMKTDYLKLRNLEIGYDIPARLLSPIRIADARIYINAQNVAVWDRMWLKDRDPESAGSGTLPYPLQRIFNIGLRLDI